MSLYNQPWKINALPTHAYEFHVASISADQVPQITPTGLVSSTNKAYTIAATLPWKMPGELLLPPGQVGGYQFQEISGIVDATLQINHLSATKPLNLGALKQQALSIITQSLNTLLIVAFEPDAMSLRWAEQQNQIPLSCTNQGVYSATIDAISFPQVTGRFYLMLSLKVTTGAAEAMIPYPLGQALLNAYQEQLGTALPIFITCQATP